MPVQYAEGRAAVAEMLRNHQNIAASLLLHFLDNTGTPCTIPTETLDKWLTDTSNNYHDGSPGPGTAIRQQISGILELAHQQAVKQGSTYDMSIRTPWVGVAGSDGDQVRSLGHYELQIAMPVTMSPDETYNGKYAAYVHD